MDKPTERFLEFFKSKVGKDKEFRQKTGFIRYIFGEDVDSNSRMSMLNKSLKGANISKTWLKATEKKFGLPDRYFYLDKEALAKSDTPSGDLFLDSLEQRVQELELQYTKMGATIAVLKSQIKMEKIKRQ